MKHIGPTLLCALGAMLLEWVWLGLMVSFFDGMSMEAATTAGVGFFLAAELVICTGIILSKFKK